VSQRDDREFRDDDAALLAALSADAAELTNDERRRGAALMAQPQLRDELAEHRALVAELRALPTRAPSPDWRALEAAIHDACDEATPRRRSWRWLGLDLRWSAGLALAGVAALLVVLWPRGPQEPPSGTLAAAPPVTRGGGAAVAAPAITAPVLAEAVTLDDEQLASEDIDEQGLGQLVEQLPSAAAITLGIADDDGGDEDELLPRATFDDDLQDLDEDSLRTLDRWLDEPRQKG
jgi:hypothetical protein